MFLISKNYIIWTLATRLISKIQIHQQRNLYTISNVYCLIINMKKRIICYVLVRVDWRPESRRCRRRLRCRCLWLQPLSVFGVFFHRIYYFPYFLTVNFFFYGRLPLITILRDEHVYPSCFCSSPGIGIQQRTRRVYVLHSVYIYIYTPYWVTYNNIILLYLLYRVCALS